MRHHHSLCVIALLLALGNGFLKHRAPSVLSHDAEPAELLSNDNNIRFTQAKSANSGLDSTLQKSDLDSDLKKDKTEDTGNMDEIESESLNVVSKNADVNIESFGSPSSLDLDGESNSVPDSEASKCDCFEDPLCHTCPKPDLHVTSIAATIVDESIRGASNAYILPPLSFEVDDTALESAFVYMYTSPPTPAPTSAPSPMPTPSPTPEPPKKPHKIYPIIVDCEDGHLCAAPLPKEDPIPKRNSEWDGFPIVGQVVNEG